MSNRVKPNYIVREIQLSDCEEVRQIWNDFGFTDAKYSNETMIRINLGGIFVAQDLDDGKILGVCSGVNLSPELAFIGQYVVKAGYHGLGIGSDIWRKCMEHIGADRNVCLIAAPDMLIKYRDKNNFRIIAKKQLIRFQGKPNLDKLIDSIDGISLQSINENNIESVVKYDKTVCDEIDRTALIREIPKNADSVNLVAINQKQEVLGYCVLFVTIDNKAIAEPLYADNEKIAELLINKCCQLLSNTTDNGLIYFCWNSNKNAVDIAHKLNLKLIIQLPILFSKNIVDGNLEKIYSVSSATFYPF